MTLSFIRSIRPAILCLTAVFVPISLPAATISVPSSATPTIQSGIDAAANGDTVLVGEGTYYENIDFKGKAITVTAGGPGATASTIIDGGSNGPAVTFKSGETRSAVLSYFSIQNGGNFNTYSGNNSIFAAGGIVISNSAPTLLGNLILHNNCWSIYATQSAPLIQGNTIFATQDPNGNCSFGGGAAIYVSGNFNGPSQSSATGVAPIIVGNIIQDNVESGLEDAGGNGGAGIAVWGGSPIIAKNIIRNNASPGGSGGAINVEGGTDVAITQNLIYGNSAGCGGGALAFDAGGSDPGGFGVLIANNTLVDNVYDKNGGGFSECTNIAQIYPNPDQYGNANHQEVFVSNIIAGNTSDPSIDGDDEFGGISEEYQPIFDHNLFYNAGGPVFGNAYVDVSAKYGNVVADPQFVDQAKHDYHLKSTSPAIDAGNTSVLQSLQAITGSAITTDFDGNPRLQDATGKGYPIIDMGAYEYAGRVDATDTTVVLTSSSYSGNAGSNYVLTATLASALGVPSGSIVFYLDGKQIGTSKIGSDGSATLANFLMTPGFHSLYASYAGSGSFTPATSVIIIVQVYLYTTSLTLTSSLDPSILNQSVTFTVTALSSDPSFIPSPITLYENGSSAPLITLTPDSAGVATYPTSSLPLGYTSISASFAGDSTHAAASTNIEQDVINGYSTVTTLTSSSNPANVGQSVTFTATLTSANGTPAGLVTFVDGATILGTQTLVNGVATLSTNALTVGTHQIAAAYSPAGTAFSASNATLSQVINGVPTTTTLTVTPTRAAFGAPIQMTARVLRNGDSVSGGLINFMDGTSVLYSSTIPLASPLVTFSTTALDAGTHIITAVYSGDLLSGPITSAPVTVTITSATTTLALSATPSPAFALQPIKLSASLTGGAAANSPINFLANGTLIGTSNTDSQGNAAFTATLSAGMYTLTATFAGTSNLAGSTASPVIEIVNPNPSPISVYAQPNPGYQGNNETLTATVATQFVSGEGPPIVPTGTVSFFDTATLISTASLDAKGQANFSTTSFTVGTHAITAVYNGTQNFLGSTSPAYSLVILPRDFTLTTDPSITIQTEHHKDLNLTLSSVGDFTDTITLSCVNLPAYATCIFPDNQSVLATGATQSGFVRIDTDALLNYVSSNTPVSQPSPWPRGRIAYGLLLPVVFIASWRRRHKLRGAVGICFGLSVLLIAATFTGCSGHYPGHTPPGTYTITINGQGATTHIAHAATVTLTVTE